MEHSTASLFTKTWLLGRYGGTLCVERGALRRGQYALLLRHRRQRFNLIDVEAEAHGLLAVCIQHEIDHLDGKVFVEYLSPLKLGRIKAKLAKKARITA